MLRLVSTYLPWGKEQLPAGISPGVAVWAMAEPRPAARATVVSTMVDLSNFKIRFSRKWVRLQEQGVKNDFIAKRNDLKLGSFNLPGL